MVFPYLVEDAELADELFPGLGVDGDGVADVWHKQL